MLSALTAQRYYQRVLYGVAPAGVASAIALVRAGELSAVVFLFAVMTITASALRANPRPLHLMPIARYVFNAFVPAAGIAVALIPGAFGERADRARRRPWRRWRPPSTTTFMADWLESRFETDRPVWTGGDRQRRRSPTSSRRRSRTPASAATRSSATSARSSPGRPPGCPGSGRSTTCARRSQPGVDRPARDRAPDAAASRSSSTPRASAWTCQVRMIEATALYEGLLGHVPIGTINSAWFQFIMHPRYSPSSPLSKRALDLFVSGMMLVAAAPVMLLLRARRQARGPRAGLLPPAARRRGGPRVRHGQVPDAAPGRRRAVGHACPRRR